YSVYEATAQNGGEVGVMPFSAFTGEFIEALADAKSGDIVKVASGDAIQLMQIYRADKPSKHIQVATISYPVEPSSATKRDVHAAASTFSVNAAGSVEKFNEAASASAVTPRIATVNQGERAIRGLDNSRELVRWVYGAEKGDMSEIFNLGDAYVVAIVTDIDNDEYKSLAKVNAQVHAAVLREKKFDYLASKVAGSTLAEVASSLGADVEEFSNVRYPSFYVDGLGFEPRVVGAVTAAETGVVSAPVRGMSGLYVFEVTDVAASDAAQTPEAEKVRAQATAENYAVQAAIGAVQQMAEIQDLRGKYF
ncbi:MAG: peptidylprolyl isomerase, partial [Alistipes sp.]|nr:peptidylprolyl isomerase [Alistipes sp.]